MTADEARTDDVATDVGTEGGENSAGPDSAAAAEADVETGESAPSTASSSDSPESSEASADAVGVEEDVVSNDPVSADEGSDDGVSTLPPPPPPTRSFSRPTGAVAIVPDVSESDAALVDATPADPDGDPEEVPDIWADLEAGPAPFDQVRFVDVSVVLPNTNPVIVLEEISLPTRILRIPVGQPEGVSIAYAARGIATPKPLTHDLFISMLEAFGITVDAVRITSVRQNAFTAEIVFSGSRGVRTLGCRPSDGIALALRQRLGAPIMVAPEVLDQVGITPPD